MTQVRRIGVLRDVLAHKLRVPTEPVAREHERVAADVLDRTVRPRDPHAPDEARVIGIERRDSGGTHDVDARARDRIDKARQQICARLMRRAMHVRCRMPGIAKTRHARQRQAMCLHQPIDGLRRLRRDALSDVCVALPLRLRDQIARQQGRGVLDPGGLLQMRSRPGDLPAGQGGVPLRTGIALQHHNLRTPGFGRQGRHAAAGAGANDDDRDMPVEGRDLAQDAHGRKLSGNGLREKEILSVPSIPQTSRPLG